MVAPVVFHCTATIFVKSGQSPWTWRRRHGAWSGLSKLNRTQRSKYVSETRAPGASSLRRLEVFCTRKVQGFHRCYDENIKRIRRIAIHASRRDLQHKSWKCRIRHCMGYCENFCLYAYKLHVVQATTADKRVDCKEFAVKRNWTKTTNSWGE